MQYTWTTMGMPAKLILADQNHDANHAVATIRQLFADLDHRFSPFHDSSEVCRFDRGEIARDYSPELLYVVTECDRSRQETNGFFDCYYNKSFDPSGLVKGYAISRAAKLLREMGYPNFLIEIAGDIQTSGKNGDENWTIGIENPFVKKEIIKIVSLSGEGIATSGTSINPDHITNPISHSVANEIKSFTIIAPDVYDADRFATAAFAMGVRGIIWAQQQGLAAYMITHDHHATMNEAFAPYAH